MFLIAFRTHSRLCACAFLALLLLTSRLPPVSLTRFLCNNCVSGRSPHGNHSQCKSIILSGWPSHTHTHTHTTAPAMPRNRSQRSHQATQESPVFCSWVVCLSFLLELITDSVICAYAFTALLLTSRLPPVSLTRFLCNNCVSGRSPQGNHSQCKSIILSGWPSHTHTHKDPRHAMPRNR